MSTAKPKLVSLYTRNWLCELMPVVVNYDLYDDDALHLDGNWFSCAVVCSDGRVLARGSRRACAAIESALHAVFEDGEVDPRFVVVRGENAQAKGDRLWWLC